MMRVIVRIALSENKEVKSVEEKYCYDVINLENFIKLSGPTLNKFSDIYLEFLCEF